MQKKISYLEQGRGQRSPSVGNNGEYFSLEPRVKYCPFHSQYVICSFPYDRSMIRFKNVLRFTVARGGPRFLSFSRLFPARTNSSVGVARHKIKLYRTRSSWKIIRVLGWNKATRITPRQEIAIYAIDVSTEWRSIEEKMNFQIDESRAIKLYLQSDNFLRWRVMAYHCTWSSLFRSYRLFPRIRSRCIELFVPSIYLDLLREEREFFASGFLN